MKVKAETKAAVEAKERLDDASKRKDTIIEWQSYAAALIAHSERQDATIEQHQRAIDALSRDNSNCREEAAEQRQCIHFIYDHLKRLHRLLTNAKVSGGVDPGELPELPAMHPHTTHGPDSQFLANQASQSAELLRESGKVISAPISGVNLGQTPAVPKKKLGDSTVDL
jgi:hypothetical protein